MNGESEMDLKLTGISNLHSRILARIGRFLVGDCQMRADRSEPYWEKGPFGGPFQFQLRSNLEANSSARHRERIPVVKMDSVAGMIWVSWREEWEKEKHQKRVARLRKVGFTFYWGEPPEIDDVLFRAEWEARGIGSVNAAQPHWHSDLAGSLEIARFHFPMAGWEYSDSHPACWQRFLDDDDALCLWVERIVEYACKQFAEYPPQIARQ